MEEVKLSNIRFIVRIRSPYDENCCDNPNDKEDSKRITYYGKQIKNIKLQKNNFYTIFTSQDPGKFLAISNKPVLGKLVNETIKRESDMNDFSNRIIKEANIFEFDKVYNETHRYYNC